MLLLKSGWEKDSDTIDFLKYEMFIFVSFIIFNGLKNLNTCRVLCVTEVSRFNILKIKITCLGNSKKFAFI